MDPIREPQEPIIAMDNLTDPEILKDPVHAAVETIAQALEKEAVVAYFSKEGQASDYARALLRMLRKKHTYQIHELGQFQCAAFVIDSAEEAPDQMPFMGQQEVDRQAAARAVAEGSVDKLLDLGVPPAEAEVAVLIRPERLQWVQQLMAELTGLRAKFAEEHGPVLYLHFLGCQEAGRGLGSKMLRHLARVADAEHKWLYLETSSEQSARLYHRQGFQDVRKVQVGGEEGREAGVPVLFIMARPPGGQGEAIREKEP